MPGPVKFRKFGDIPQLRQDVYDSAVAAFQDHPGFQNATHRFEISDVGYDGDFNPTKTDEKKAILQGGSLQRPLRGTVKLVNLADNKVLDQKRTVLAMVPHINSRGLVIKDGVIWSFRNQARLRPGIYTREKKDGGVETHFNVKPRTGRGFRIELEPETGIFKVRVDQSTTRLYPVLRAMGVEDDELKSLFGEELYQKNYRAPSGHDQTDVAKLLSKLGSNKVQVAPDMQNQALKEVIERMEVDEDTSELTMGEKVKNLSPSVLLQAVKKIQKVARGEALGDNRDSQAFQSIHSAEDFIKERLQNDQAGGLRKLLYLAARDGNLGKLQSGILKKNVDALFQGSGLTQAVEDINPFEVHDQHQAVTRLGEHGISSEQMVSRDARGIQASYIGVVDPIRGPESSRLGLDLRVTDAALKGSDNQLYTTVINAKTGKPEILSARTISSKIVAFPGELEKADKRIIGIQNDKVTYVPRDKVDYVIANPNHLFSRSTNMIPFPQGIKGQRLLMGARMTQQAMPLQDAEAPLVQTADDEGASLHGKMGDSLGAARSDTLGVVTKVTPDSIELMTPQGTKTYDLYNNYPTARKTTIHNTPVVQPGQTVRPGQLLAHSNFTDKNGTAAIGKNLKVAFMVAEGGTIEDAFVISESAAKKLSSEALYRSDLDLSRIHSTKKADYQALYADKFKPEQLDTLDDDGVVKEGTVVNSGDPLILGIGKKDNRAVGALMQSSRSAHSDKAQTWDHHAPGVVTDIAKTRGGIKVTVKSYDPMKVADKLTPRFGSKGVISEIRPDDQMPTDASGQPVEVITNALGVISRVNPAYLAESLLGKIAAKTGKPYVVRGFSNPEGIAEFALQEGVKHGLVKLDAQGNPVDTEELTDPRDGRKIKNVFVGNSYFMKLHHMAESKLSARDVAGYTSEGYPARGGYEGSKRIGQLDVYSLISAGATDFLKDAKLIRGQRNDDYWRAIRTGDTPAVPDMSFASDQFRSQLKAAGVNLREEGTRTGLAPLLDKDVDELASHEIQNSSTYDFETMRPKEGGLFDITATGGAGGDRFSKIVLPTKLPHPLFQEPVQKLLGVTGAQLERIMSGEEEYHGKTGPAALEEGLKEINIDRDIEASKEAIRSGKKTHRDAAVKRLNYLVGLKKMGIQPTDLLISRIPVIPPKYRPIVSAGGMDMVHDLNYLYHDLMEAKQNYTDAAQEFGDHTGEEYLTLYNSVKAIVGVREPVNPKSAEQGVKGVLKYALGIGESPKHAMYMRRVIGTAVDTVGRGVITSDKDLDMDEVGIPKDMAWTVFQPYVIRRLVRYGLPAAEAVKEVQERTPRAKSLLLEEMHERPIVYNRAPSLHRYNYVGAWAKLRDDDAIGLPYAVLKGIGGDYDGDQINIHVPSSSEAVRDAATKLMPSKNLFHAGTFETHLEPVQDYVAGLYLASTPNTKEPIRTFRTAEEAKRAYARGEISARTPIKILERS